MGAYTAGILSVHGITDPIVTALCGMMLAAVAGLAFGLAMLRTKGLTLLMLTMASAFLLYEIANKATGLTGGEDGLQGVSFTPLLGLFAFATPISPFIISTSRFEMASPSPVPPYLRVVDPSAWLNAWNRCRHPSSLIPMPVSCTVKRTVTSKSHWRTDGTDDNLTTLRELDGIGDEVHQDLTQLSRIAAQGGQQIVVHQRHEFQSLALRILGQQFNRAFDRGSQVEVDRFERQFAGFNLGQVEDVVDEREQGIAAGADGVHELVLFGVERRIEQQARHLKGALLLLGRALHVLVVAHHLKPEEAKDNQNRPDQKK